MQSLHSVSCVGANSAAAFPIPRLHCYVSFAHRMRAGAAAVTSSIRARSRPMHAVAAAGSVETATQPSADTAHLDNINFFGVHHVGILVQDLGRSKEFYCDTLGLSINNDRPDGKLPYDGVWLWMGPEMLHLMVLPNPDPMSGRPDHGGRDRHVCVGVKSIKPVEQRLKAKGVQYTSSKSGRAAVFFRDPDMNVLEVFESKPWR